jgi:histone chaperone ASF1
VEKDAEMTGATENGEEQAPEEDDMSDAGSVDIEGESEDEMEEEEEEEGEAEVHEGDEMDVDMDKPEGAPIPEAAKTEAMAH